MTETTRSEIRAALRELLPVLLAVVPFGMVYGTIATAEGLSFAQTMGFSATVYAGASQLEARASVQPLTKTFYFAYGCVLYVGWLASSALGAVFGSLIDDPTRYGLDFILPVYFLTLLMTFRARSGFYPVALTSAAASIVVYLTLGPPWHVTLGGLAGIAVAALMPPKPVAAPAQGEDRHG